MKHAKRYRFHTLGTLLLSLIPFGLLAVLLSVTILVSAGLFITPTFTSPPKPHVTKPVVVSIPTDNTPAQAVLTGLTNSLKTIDPTYNYAAGLQYVVPSNPSLLGCSQKNLNNIPVPSITNTATLTSSSSTVMFRVDAYGAGLGQRVVERTSSDIKNCGNGNLSNDIFPLNGFTSNSDSSNEVIFRQGDIVITLIDFGGSSLDTLSLGTKISNTLLSSMTSTCKNMNAPASAALLNPTQADYSPKTTLLTFSPPAGSANSPDMSLLTQTPPVAPIPTIGSIEKAPLMPVSPTISLTTNLSIRVSDPVGPGCGWSFTGEASPPSPSASSIASEKKTAINKLLEVWTSWPATVNRYLQAMSTYNANLDSYNAYQAELATNPPSAPTGLYANSNDTYVTLHWNASNDSVSPITGYTVTAKDSSGHAVGTCLADAYTTSCSVLSLTNGTSYTFSVMATNANGQSPSSNTVSSTPKANPIPTPTTTTTVPPTTTTTTVPSTTTTVAK